MAKIGDYLNYLVVSQRELRKRQHLIAKSAMAAHGSSDCRFEEVHESSIALIGVMKLRVTPAKGSERFLLSIHCRLPYWGVNASRASIDAYLQWLLYLHEQTDFVVQEPLRNRSGDLITDVPVAACDNEPIYYTLHRWVAGVDLPKDGSEYTERVGAILGRLHEHASQWPAPDDFARPEYTSEDLDAALTVLRKAADEGRIAAGDFDALEQIADRVGRSIDALGRNRQTWGVIHGDFTSSACVRDGESLHLIDVDDCCVGLYLSDLGNSFKSKALRRDPAGSKDFISGYASVRSLPGDYARLVEGFVIAAWIRNWARWREPNITFYNLPECVSNECTNYLKDEPFLHIR